MTDTWLSELLGRYFLALVALTLLLGLLLLFSGKRFFTTREYREFVRDLGIALVISSLVTLLIEQYSHNRREAEARTGLINSVLGRVMPPEVWEELRSSVITKPALCTSWRLDVVISKPVVPHPDGIYIASSTLTYTLRNQTNQDARISIQHELESEIPGTLETGETLPRFSQLLCQTIDQTAGAPIIDLGPKELQDKRYWRDDAHFEVPVVLPASPSLGIQVVLKRDELMRAPGQYSWYMVWVTTNITVSVDSRAIPEYELRVFPRHPNPERLRATRIGLWGFSGAMLPGQGLAIVASRR